MLVNRGAVVSRSRGQVLVRGAVADDQLHPPPRLARPHELSAPWALVAKLSAATLVMLLSIVIVPMYTDGDPGAYRRVYDTLPNLDLIDGFEFYANQLTSREYVHYVLTWIGSRYVERDLFIVVSNGLLAYAATSALLNLRASVVVALSVVLTNFYMLVLYFAAERLKYAFFFLALSIIQIDRLKWALALSTLSVLSHVQMLIVYTSLMSSGLSSALLKDGVRKLAKLTLIALGALVPVWLLRDYIGFKMSAYFDSRTVLELARIVVFALLAMWYSQDKRQTVALFIPVMIAVFVVGGDRVNMFGYFLFLYYGVQVKGGWNLGVLATSTYFAYSSFTFLRNVIEHGDGFWY